MGNYKRQMNELISSAPPKTIYLFGANPIIENGKGFTVKSHLRRRSTQELKEARVAAYEYLIP